MADVVLEGLERALEAGYGAVRVIDRAFSPLTWARNQLRVGTAHARHADVIGHTEYGITALLAALEIFTADDYPEEFRVAKSALSGLYLRRTVGDLEENRRRALESAAAAQSVIDPQRGQ